MKYLIHHTDGSGYYVIGADEKGNFSWNRDIKYATRFKSISDILKFVVSYGYAKASSGSSLTNVQRVFDHRVEILVIDE